jgi:hypothetical protein
MPVLRKDVLQGTDILRELAGIPQQFCREAGCQALYRPEQERRPSGASSRPSPISEPFPGWPGQLAAPEHRLHRRAANLKVRGGIQVPKVPNPVLRGIREEEYQQSRH